MVGPEAYVDANVFVYWLGNHPRYGKAALEWIKKIESVDRKRYVTSTLAIYQVLVVLAGLTGRSLKDRELVRTASLISDLPGLVVSPLTLEDLRAAEGLMGEFALDYEDALHLASALRNKAKGIISNDHDFDKTPLRRSFE